MNDLKNIYELLSDYNNLQAFGQNIVIHDYTETRKFCLEMCRRNINGSNAFNPKFVIIITGNIAAGKSTIAYNLIKYYNMYNIPLLSNDLIRAMIFEGASEYNIKQNHAKEYLNDKIHDFSDNGTSFIWETMITTKKKIDTINSLKAKGYKIVTIYVETTNVDININRALSRSKEGSHFLGTEFILDRRDKTSLYIFLLASITDVMVRINNTDFPIIMKPGV